MDTLGRRIKFVREQKGWNQSEFAEKLGLKSPMAVSKYEKDQREPDISKLIKVAEIGSVSLDWLLTGEAEKKEPTEMREERGLPGLSTLERVYVDRLLEILRTKDQGTVSAITQNIDTFLRVPTEKPPLEEKTKKKA